uniref:PDZ domain-containing protein n=1 Tax=Ditylenchus dipsaci TaxID=166011 RepID=A0A915DD81_9BILA
MCALNSASNKIDNALEDIISPERQKLINRRDGFVYLLIRMDVVEGKSLGLRIGNSNNRVIITRVEEGSMADGKFQAKDHINDVEGQQVSDRDTARNLLISSMQKQKFVTCVVGRRNVDPPSIRLSKSVRNVAQLQRFKERSSLQPRTGLFSSISAAPPPRVLINEAINNVFDIGTDSETVQVDMPVTIGRIRMCRNGSPYADKED